MGRCQLMILLLTLCLINFNSRAKPPDIVWRVDTVTIMKYSVRVFILQVTMIWC